MHCFGMTIPSTPPTLSGMAIQGCPEDSPCSCEFNNPPWFTPGLLKLRDITGPILVHAGVAAVAATSVGTVVFGAGQTARRAAY